MSGQTAIRSPAMTSLDDVAAYLLDVLGPTDAMKLHRLLFLSHGYHLAWDDEPLIAEPFTVWASGPVCEPLHQAHRHTPWTIETWLGDPHALTNAQQESINAVLEAHRHLSCMQLTMLIASTDLWQHARTGLRVGERSDRVLDDAAIQAQFLNLLAHESAAC